MIRERRHSEKKEERYDLFSSLLDANSDENCYGEQALSDRELIGNLFIFLLGGKPCQRTRCVIFLFTHCCSGHEVRRRFILVLGPD